MLVITSARVVARPASAAVRTSGGRLRSRASVAPARQILGLSRVRSVGGGPALSRRRVVGAALADEDDELDEGFGDIDRLAADDEAKSAADSDLSDPSVEQTFRCDIGVNEVAEFGLSGRPLYVCQTMVAETVAAQDVRAGRGGGARHGAALRPRRAHRAISGSRTRWTTTTACLSRTRRDTPRIATRSAKAGGAHGEARRRRSFGVPAGGTTTPCSWTRPGTRTAC